MFSRPITFSPDGRTLLANADGEMRLRLLAAHRRLPIRGGPRSQASPGSFHRDRYGVGTPLSARTLSPARCVVGAGGFALAIVLRVAYAGAMTTMLTVRVDAEQRQRLRARAAAQGKTEAELLRAMLERELADEPLASRVAGLRGSLTLPRRTADAWRRQIRRRNWRR
jgi:hypothetical protein